MRWWILACLMGCSAGLQTTGTDCSDGYERGEDGGCYESSGSDTDDDGSPTGGNAGDVDEGPPDEGGDEGVGDEGQSDDDTCESEDDCPISVCPEGSMGCTCQMEIGICLPTCNEDEDCPQLDGEDGLDVAMECVDGVCDLPIVD
jgi:hypothetical protein